MLESGATSVRQRRSRPETRRAQQRGVQSGDEIRRAEHSEEQRRETREETEAQRRGGAEVQRLKPAEFRTKGEKGKQVGTRWDARSYIGASMCAW